MTISNWGGPKPPINLDVPDYRISHPLYGPIKSGYKCDFCGKDKTKVLKMVEAVTGALICSECVEQANELISAAKK